MARIDSESYEERKLKVLLSVRMNPGSTTAELANEIGMQRRTLDNYLVELERESKVYKDRRYWYVTDHQTTQLRRLDLTPEQGVSLYLAARALARVQDERNETVETALLQLAEAIKGSSSVGQDIYRAAQELATRPERTGYNKVFRELMQSYVYRKKVRITYLPASGSAFETTFEPHLFEPSLFGFSIYAIGWSSLPGAYRTYKLERIQAAALTSEDFEIRADAPTLASLRSAWSVIYGDQTETVKLRFSPEARKRVLETNWHYSQRTNSDDPNDPSSLDWQVTVADLTDMMPWIKGWGNKAQAIAPDKLINELRRDAERLAKMYSVSSLADALQPYRLLWAKADKKTSQIHRLVYHMIDVGQCALALWQYGLHDALKQRITNWLGLPIEEAGRLIAFWTSLHDLGKASPAFQDHQHMTMSLRTVVMNDLKAAGFHFGHQPGDMHARHEVISTWALRSTRGEGLLTALCGTPAEFADLIAQMLGGHHGAFPTANKFNPLN